MGIRTDASELLASLYQAYTEGEELDDYGPADLEWEDDRYRRARKYLMDKDLLEKEEESIELTPQGIDQVEQEIQAPDSHTQQIDNDGNATMQDSIFRGNGEVINQQFNQNMDNSIEYKGQKKGLVVAEYFSIGISRLLDERQQGVLGISSTILGAVLMFVTPISMVANVESAEVTTFSIFSYLPEMPSYFLSGGFVLFLAGLGISELLKHRKKRKCPKCGSEHSLKEYKDPDITKKSAGNETIEIVTRYFECKECGKRFPKEFVDDGSGDDSAW